MKGDAISVNKKKNTDPQSCAAIHCYSHELLDVQYVIPLTLFSIRYIRSMNVVPAYIVYGMFSSLLLKLLTGTQVAGTLLLSFPRGPFICFGKSIVE